jgi:hypothetical protein
VKNFDGIIFYYFFKKEKKRRRRRRRREHRLECSCSMFFFIIFYVVSNEVKKKKKKNRREEKKWNERACSFHQMLSLLNSKYSIYTPPKPTDNICTGINILNLCDHLAVNGHRYHFDELQTPYPSLKNDVTF